MSHPTSDLLARLESFNLDEPGVTFPFTHRLARENGWSREFAARVVREYKRFVCLAMEAGHPVTPSEEVDQAWHLHLVYTRSYWEEMCGRVLGRPLHHGPTEGGGAEQAKFRDWYAATLSSYRRMFAEDPPADIWPPPGRRFAPRKWRWVDLSRQWMVPKPRVPDWTPEVGRAAVAIAMLAFLLGGCVAGMPVASIFDWSGTAFLGFYLAALVVAVALSWALVHRRRPVPLENSTVPSLDALELATLVGGVGRVVEAGLAGLSVRNVIQPAPGHADWFQRGQPMPPDAAGIELAVANCLPRSGVLDCSALRRSLAPLVERTRDRLSVAGLVRTAEERFSVAVVRTSPLLILLALGLWRVILGFDHHRPVGFLLMLCGAAAWLAYWFGKLVPWRTPKGDAVLAHVRATHGELERPTEATLGSDPGCAVRAVALFGPAALRLGCPALAAWITVRPPVPSAGDSVGGSGCGSGCGSSDGSSGCCSGCGGCGGCGGGN